MIIVFIYGLESRFEGSKPFPINLLESEKIKNMEIVTKNKWKALNKDYKTTIDKQKYILKLINGGTCLVPVTVINDKESLKIKKLLKKEIENMDSLIQNLEYELNEVQHPVAEQDVIDDIIEKYARIRQKLIELEEVSND